MRANELSRIGVALSLWSAIGCAPRPESKAPATAQAAQAPAVQPTSEPPAPSAPAAAPKAPAVQPSAAKPRIVHPQPDSKDCVEMYGTCSPPPDEICTSSAFVLSCGETGKPPGSKQAIQCVCP